MKAKLNGPADDDKPRARNRKGVKRDKAIQIRVSQEEKLRIRATHGRCAPAVARAFLLGLPALRRSALEDSGKRQVMHALHAHCFELKRTRFMATKAEPADLLAQLDNQERTLTHLLRVCFSNFSR
jgi:hypothetical protein